MQMMNRRILTKVLTMKALAANIRGNSKKHAQISIICELQRAYWIADDKRKCDITKCPLPHQFSWRYCSYHSAALIQHASESKAKLSFTRPRWNPIVTSETEKTLRILECYRHKTPEITWIMDYESIQHGSGLSPILSLQLGIGQIDGKLLLATNVDYAITLPQFVETISVCTETSMIMSSIFTHCYSSY